MMHIVPSVILAWMRQNILIVKNVRIAEHELTGDDGISLMTDYGGKNGR